MELIKKKQNADCSFVSTTFSRVDEYLWGGIPASSLTEIVGPAGVGKTQLCHMLTIVTSMPLENGGLNGYVAYFDTEKTFSIERLIEIAKSRFPDYFASNESILNLTQRVLVFDLSASIDSLIELRNLEELIIEKNVKLVIIDSIAIMKRESSQTLRHTLIHKLASQLKNLAENFSIPVVVVNQVTTKIEKEGYVTPALGITWAHSVNIRLVLEYFGNLKRLIIAKSPCAPVVAFFYQISEKGIELDLESEQILPDNYWEAKIITRSSIAPGIKADTQQSSLFMYPPQSKKQEFPLTLQQLFQS